MHSWYVTLGTLDVCLRPCPRISTYWGFFCGREYVYLDVIRNTALRAWFSRLLRQLARKCSTSIITTLKPALVGRPIQSRGRSYLDLVGYRARLRTWWQSSLARWKQLHTIHEYVQLQRVTANYW